MHRLAGALPVVRVALCCAISMPEVLIRGLVGGGQENVETTQPTHKAAGSQTSYSKSMVITGLTCANMLLDAYLSMTACSMQEEYAA